jgi:hypothetical protein
MTFATLRFCQTMYSIICIFFLPKLPPSELTSVFLYCTNSALVVKRHGHWLLCSELILLMLNLYGKVKQSRYTAWMRLGGGRRYNAYLFTTSALDGMSGQRYTPAALYPRRKDHRYPLDRRFGGPHSRSEHRR